VKSISAGLLSHIAQPVTTIRTIVRVTRRDQQVFGFTDSDIDISYSGVLYKAATGASASAVESTSDLATDNLDVLGLLSGPDITEADLEAGLWDGAQVRVSHVNVSDLTHGEMVLRVGQFGEVSRSKGSWQVEVRGLMNALQRTITRTYLPTCDADLGDSRCGVNLAGVTGTGTVTSVTDNRQFVASALVGAVDVYAGGRLTWTSGQNTGRQMEVRSNTGSGGVTLFLPMPSNVLIGDQFSIVQGCNKTTDHCKVKFNNLVNFRGFPHVPGVDKTLRYGGT
jgi:uncharacterized phage protein (TIGR02218 family)